MKFIPQYDKVLILPERNLERIGKIWMADNVFRKRRVGTVVAVGNGKDKDHPVYIPIGATVMFNLNAGTEIWWDKTMYLNMSQEEILVVFDEKEELGFKVLTTRIMILPDDVEEKVGNIVIPRVSQQIARKGTVVAVGEEIKDEMLPLVKGDYVSFYGNAGSGLISGEDFNLKDGKKYLILRPQQICGKYLTI